MKEVWPEKAGTICARVGKGVSNQVLSSAEVVAFKIIPGGVKFNIGCKLL